VAIQYRIESGVLILRVASEGFAFLRDALRTAASDPAARPGMPLLLDVRTEPSSHRYEDARWRMQILADMREQFGPRWALLCGRDPVPVGVGRMVAVFSGIDGLEVGLFAEKHTALRWLREETQGR
jgi:hypothetical protein